MPVTSQPSKHMGPRNVSSGKCGQLIEPLGTIKHNEVQSTLFIPTLDTTTKFIIMIV